MLFGIRLRRPALQRLPWIETRPGLSRSRARLHRRSLIPRNLVCQWTSRWPSPPPDTDAHRAAPGIRETRCLARCARNAVIRSRAPNTLFSVPARGRSSRSRPRLHARARRDRSANLPRVGNDDGCVIYSQKQPAVGRCHFGCPFRREIEDLQGMAVGVAEIEGADTAGVRVPVGQPLRFRRGVLYLVLAQPLIGAVHVADDDGDVLEPAVVAARVRREGRPWAQILGQLDEFVSQLQARDARAQAEDARQVLVVRRRRTSFRRLSRRSAPLCRTRLNGPDPTQSCQ